LQDDLKKFVSEPPLPPQEVEIPEEGKTKAKERREVSRFSRPGLPHVPLVQDPPASLEASLAKPSQKPRNASRKRVTKKLKVTKTTSPEVSRPE
jgi:hypothetical protein